MPQLDQLSRHSGHLTPSQMREIRKELLVTRASLERVDLLTAQSEWSRQMARYGWISMLVPGLRRRAEDSGPDGALARWMSHLPPFLQPVVSTLLPVLHRHPIGSAVLSWLLGAAGERRAAAIGPAKWIGAALFALKALRLVRQVKGWRQARKAHKR